MTFIKSKWDPDVAQLQSWVCLPKTLRIKFKQINAQSLVAFSLSISFLLTNNVMCNLTHYRQTAGASPCTCVLGHSIFLRLPQGTDLGQAELVVQGTYHQLLSRSLGVPFIFRLHCAPFSEPVVAGELGETVPGFPFQPGYL